MGCGHPLVETFGRIRPVQNLPFCRSDPFMSKLDNDFFLDGTLPPDEEADLMRHLKAWHRVALCAAFFAAMAGYLGWLVEG